MRIGGFQKLSFVDFPESIASVVFTQGCNWRCPWCHNPSLVYPEQFEASIPEEEIFQYLKKRTTFIEGVVVSGGEPTLQNDLPAFLGKVRELGYRTKLDTNGSHPAVIVSLLDEGLLDAIAMDIKASPCNYPKIVGVPVDIGSINASVRLIRESGIPFQFRTTVLPHLHQPEDGKAIADWMEGVEDFLIQDFQTKEGSETTAMETETTELRESFVLAR